MGAWSFLSLHSCCCFYDQPGKGLEGACFLNVYLCMDNSFKRKKFRINMVLVTYAPLKYLCAFYKSRTGTAALVQRDLDCEIACL